MPPLRARSHSALRPHSPKSARHSHLLAILEDLTLVPPHPPLELPPIGLPSGAIVQIHFYSIAGGRMILLHQMLATGNRSQRLPPRGSQHDRSLNGSRI